MSFNIQCAFSRQVLSEGDACQVIVIQQRTTPSPLIAELNGVSHLLNPAPNVFAVPDNRWTMASAFLAGEYLGEGRIGLFDNEHNKRALLRLVTVLHADSLVVPSQGPQEPPVFDIKRMVTLFAPSVAKLMEDPFAPLDVEFIPFAELASLWSYIEEVIQQGKVFLMNETRMPCALGMCAVHQVAFENLCQVGENSRAHDIDYSRKAFFASLGDMLEGHVEAEDIEQHALMPWTVFQLQANTLTRLQRQENALILPFETQLKHNAMKLVLNQELQTFVTQTASILDGFYVFRGVSLLNLHFEPSHLVNTDSYHLTGAVYADFVQSTAQIIQNKQRILQVKAA